MGLPTAYSLPQNPISAFQVLKENRAPQKIGERPTPQAGEEFNYDAKDQPEEAPLVENTVLTEEQLNSDEPNKTELSQS